MAEVTVDGAAVRIGLTRFEKIAGLLRDQQIPIGSVTGVDVEPEPRAALRGLRAPGLAVPGRTMIGTWRGRGHKMMVRIRRAAPAVRITAEGAPFDAYLVSVDDAEGIAERIRERIGG